MSAHHDPDQGCVNVFEEIEEGRKQPCGGTSCTTTPIAFFALFSNRSAILSPRLHPHVNRVLSIQAGLRYFNEVFTDSVPQKGSLRL